MPPSTTMPAALTAATASLCTIQAVMGSMTASKLTQHMIRMIVSVVPSTITATIMLLGGVKARHWLGCFAVAKVLCSV